MPSLWSFLSSFSRGSGTAFYKDSKISGRAWFKGRPKPGGAPYQNFPEICNLPKTYKV
jgi:hypothetical protein